MSMANRIRGAFSVGMFLLAGVVEGQVVRTPEEFVGAGEATKRNTLVQLITREANLTNDQAVALVAAALADGSEAVRAAAVSTMISRLGAPWHDPTYSPSAAAQAERESFDQLRPELIRTLASDPAIRVRRQAVAALIGLDLDPAVSVPAPSESTQQTLVGRFYADTAGSVRAAIVSAFAHAPIGVSEDIRRVLLDALSDPHPAVRGSALIGLLHVDSSEAGARLIQMLDDPDRGVRLRATLELLKRADSLRAYRDAVRELIEREPDPQVQRYLQTLAVRLNN